MHPFSNWRWHHAAHHGSAGDLDRRGQGDVPTMTVAEWHAASPLKKTGYWLFRHPAVMFTIGPLWSLVIGPRIPPKNASKKLRRSVHLTNLALLVLIGGICVLIGPLDYLLIQAPTVFLAGSAGVWLFYVQHQFEDVYWENADAWSYEASALEGSSYLKLPQPLQFFTGNIGLHHVHHLNARIPNYNLQARPRRKRDLPLRSGPDVLGRDQGDPPQALGRRAGQARHLRRSAAERATGAPLRFPQLLPRRALQR